ncbi:MAG: peptidylprolyl isomerase, partial [Alphaproteobacteria bacterium]|nr:peptidylprolyl isomerase [Alphaproteobacteria bacterium]
MKLKSILSALILAALPANVPASATAQNLYAPVIEINNSAVTRFEVEQRAAMLRLIGTIGDVEKQALKDLIDDRLKLQAGRAMGLGVTAEETTAGMAEFAQRANLTSEQFVEELGKAGVYAETFVDFVDAGLLWRKVIQFRFQSKAFITEAELDTAMALGTTALSASVLLSEIVVPFTPETEAD